MLEGKNSAYKSISLPRQTTSSIQTIPHTSFVGFRSTSLGCEMHLFDLNYPKAQTLTHSPRCTVDTLSLCEDYTLSAAC